ncbi:hypothetical protein DERP_007130 [Dermatophagoides pteronyssinus]|uniref:One cut domain family member n=1 Tax=Dermatophagoides pteronyssinus TaxID=6956 RepID=A0ABQ8JUU5_DERPT|nr:hypothetical protein DERP_007130 [Dermatophagoides pteronyssinus]
MNLRSNRYYPSGADHQSTVAEIFGNNVDAKFSPLQTPPYVVEGQIDVDQTQNSFDDNVINSNVDFTKPEQTDSMIPPTSTILIVTEQELNEAIDIDTIEIAEQVNKELETMNIQRQLFGRHVLHCGSTKMFNLLRKPRPWSEMLKHPKQYSEKMQSYLLLKKWLELPRQQRHDELVALNEWYLHLAANREQELGQPRPSLDRIRGERTKFTQTQLTILEEYFNENPYLTADKMNELVEKLNLAPPKINEWFHGRRKKWCQQHSDNKELIENFRKKGRQYRNRSKQMAFNDEQIEFLERTFHENPWLDYERRRDLAKKLETTEQRIRNWFNSRRNRFKHDQLYVPSKPATNLMRLPKEKKAPTRIQRKREQCATNIQSWWRGHCVRKILEQQSPKFTIIRERLRFIRQNLAENSDSLIRQFLNVSKLIERNFSISNDQQIPKETTKAYHLPSLTMMNDQIQKGCQLSLQIFEIIQDFERQKQQDKQKETEKLLRNRLTMMGRQQQTMLMTLQRRNSNMTNNQNNVRRSNRKLAKLSITKDDSSNKIDDNDGGDGKYLSISSSSPAHT